MKNERTEVEGQMVHTYARTHKCICVCLCMHKWRVFAMRYSIRYLYLMITPIILYEIRENELVLKHLISTNPALVLLLYHEHRLGMWAGSQFTAVAWDQIIQFSDPENSSHDFVRKERTLELFVLGSKQAPSRAAFQYCDWLGFGKCPVYLSVSFLSLFRWLPD